MLVLERKQRENIFIEVPPSTETRLIVVCVCDIRGGTSVKLGIEAPRDCPVHREEVWDAIQKQRQEAGTNG